MGSPSSPRAQGQGDHALGTTLTAIRAVCLTLAHCCLMAGAGRGPCSNTPRVLGCSYGEERELGKPPAGPAGTSSNLMAGRRQQQAPSPML